MAIPAIESVATFGIATAAELHSGHVFEIRIWEQIVNQIDPTLKICKLDGLLFKTDDDLNKHMQEHKGQNSGSVMGMGMMGMMVMGMLGMGMMMPGMLI